MFKKTALFALVGLILALGTSCVLPGTATMNLRNDSGKAIFHVYYWETAAPADGIDYLNRTSTGNTIPDGENRVFYGIEPGDCTILVAYDLAGTDTETKTQTFQQSHYVWVTF